MIPEMELGSSHLQQWSHNWRMTVFFIISGFFALMIFQRKEAAHFAKDRVIRLGLALILFATLYDTLDGKPQGWTSLVHLPPPHSVSAHLPSEGASKNWRTDRGIQQVTSWSSVGLCAHEMVCISRGGAVSIAGSYADIVLRLVYFAFCFALDRPALTKETLFVGFKGLLIELSPRLNGSRLHLCGCIWTSSDAECG